jgi:DNA repair exonuclease SbcCD ATPase subunit
VLRRRLARAASLGFSLLSCSLFNTTCLLASIQKKKAREADMSNEDKDKNKASFIFAPNPSFSDMKLVQQHLEKLKEEMKTCQTQLVEVKKEVEDRPVLEVAALKEEAKDQETTLSELKKEGAEMKKDFTTLKVGLVQVSKACTEIIDDPSADRFTVSQSTGRGRS